MDIFTKAQLQADLLAVKASYQAKEVKEKIVASIDAVLAKLESKTNFEDEKLMLLEKVKEVKKQFSEKGSLALEKIDELIQGLEQENGLQDKKTM